MKRYIGIDPSTKTGLVILDQNGNILDSMEIEREGKDPERMMDIIESVIQEAEYGDIIAIEGFGFASQSGFLLGGIGWGIRMGLVSQRNNYIEVAPAALKKFASGKGTTKKDGLSVEIFKRWGFEHESDNVRDAYVLSQIARALHEPVKLTAFQQEVIDAIRNPKAKAKAKTKKKVAAQ